jgi:hypothetical protein
MSLEIGFFLIAIGAILTFAVTANTNGVDLHTVGWILMGVGLANVLLSLSLWSDWVDRNVWASRERVPRHGEHHDLSS